MLHKPVRAVGAFLLLGTLALTACECEEGGFSATLGELAAVPNPVAFGEVPVSTVKTIDVTLKNGGNATVHLHDLEISLNPEDFSLSIPEELVFPYAITAGSQVVFTVRYHPQSYPEDDEGAVLITSTDKDAPEYNLPCTGQAVEPILLVEPVPVDFESERVLSTAPRTLKITHTGSVPETVSISNIQITDTGDGDFNIQDGDQTPVTLNAGESHSVRMAYTPQEIDDADEGNLLIESDAESQESMDVPLLGSSHAPAIEVSTSALNFGTVSEGANPTIPFDIRSIGNDPLTIEELSLSATGSQKFEINPAVITDPIPPLEKVTVNVTFIADDRGDDDGTLMIAHDDPLERPVFIQLHGRTPEPDVDIIPDRWTIRLASESHTQAVDINIHNVGDENLLVLGMAFDNPDGSFSIESQPVYPATVEPQGNPALVVVRFTKDTPTQDDTALLTFTTDDPDEQTVVVTVVGTYSP